jgi:hypothetical protein
VPRRHRPTGLLTAPRIQQWWPGGLHPRRDAADVKILDALGDAGRSELERLEASIDRISSEVAIRVGLLEALIVAAVAVQRHDFQPWWLIGCLAVAAALTFQIGRRLRALSGELKSSNILRRQAVESSVALREVR